MLWFLFYEEGESINTRMIWMRKGQKIISSDNRGTSVFECPILNRISHQMNIQRSIPHGNCEWLCNLQQI
jgi:hypothetical protein